MIQSPWGGGGALYSQTYGGPGFKVWAKSPKIFIKSFNIKIYNMPKSYPLNIF